MAAIVPAGLALMLLTLQPAARADLIKNYEIEKSAYNACTEAASLLRQQSYAQARNILLDAAKTDPTSYSRNIHVELASAYQGLGDWNSAIAQYKLAQQLDPSYIDANYRIGITYYNIHDYDNAAKAMKKYIAQGGTEPDANKLLREITVADLVHHAADLQTAERLEDALTDLRKAAKYDPNFYSAHVHGSLSHVLERLGKPAMAISEGEKSLQLDPSQKNVVYSVAVAYQDMGKFNEAISWFRRYLLMETDPARKVSTENFIQELADDRAKLDPAANSKPDYLDEMSEADHVYRWPRSALPLKVWIAPGKGQRGYKPKFDAYVPRALDAWCAASGNRLSYKLVTDPKDCDISVEWTQDPLTKSENGRSRQKQGLTWPTLDTGSNLIAAKVQVRTVNGFDPNRNIRDGECASTTMHEIGHALGLGHSTNCADIMYFGSSTEQRGVPVARDKATLLRLYHDYPVIATAAPPPKPVVQVHVEPPPGFLPPTAPDLKKLMPPLFVPPPLKSEKELKPPLFTPPPAVTHDKNLRAPMFVPPPAAKTKRKDPLPAPFFVPPPK